MSPDRVQLACLSDVSDAPDGLRCSRCRRWTPTAADRGGDARGGQHDRRLPHRDRLAPRSSPAASACGRCVAIAAAQVGGGPACDDVVRGGVACELVHLGSLYHDDVIDEADTRRGVETVNAKWGNLQAILAGDFLLSRASEIAASLGTEVAGLLARTIGWLCEGEIEQLRHTYDVARPEEPATSRRSRARPRRCSARRRASAASSPGSTARPIDDAHRVRPRLRHGVPDRRRHPRHHRHRRAARQAGRPRHGRGRLHAARPAHARRVGGGRRGAARPARPAARRRRAGQGAGHRPRQRRGRERGGGPPVRRRGRGRVRGPPGGTATDALRAAPAALLGTVFTSAGG